MIQLNRLEGFYWVAEAGGYAAAARAFPYPITQPAVFQQVKKLEAEVGASLFERVGKDRLVLTPAGRTLFDFVAPFYTGLKPLLRDLGAAADGELRIQAAPLFLRHLLPAWLRRVQRRHPDLRVDLKEMRNEDLEPLVSGDADLLVLAAIGELDGDVDAVQVATLHAFLVVPANHALAQRARLRPRDLADETFVAYSPGTPEHDLQMQELEREGVAPPRILTTTAADTILGLVEAGIGYSLVPSLTPNGPRVKGIVARPVGGKRHAYPVYAAWRRGSAGNPLLDAMLEVAPAC